RNRKSGRRRLLTGCRLGCQGIKAAVSNDADQTDTDVPCHNASRLAHLPSSPGPLPDSAS
ncbi:unnamed protein product, partial [Gadus morhua 'NCC']